MEEGKERIMPIRTLLTIAALLVVAGTAGAQGEIPWKTDPKAAMEEAKKTGKPMMLYFTSQG